MTDSTEQIRPLIHPKQAARPAERPRKLAVVMVVCLLVGLYLAGLTAQWWPTDDSAMYLATARSLAEGRGYSFNGQPNDTAGPVLPVALSGVISLFGEQMLIFNLLLCLCGLATLWMIYRAMTLLDSRDAAVWVLAATALNYAFYFNAHRILTDMPFTLAYWAMLGAALRWWRDGRWFALPMCFLLAATCVLVRVPGLILLACTVAALVVDSRGASRLRGLAAAGAVAFGSVAAAGGFWLFVYSAAGQMPTYARMVTRHISHDAMRHLQDYAAGLTKLPQALLELFLAQQMNALYIVGLLPCALVLLGVCRLWKEGRRLPVVLVVLYPLALIALSADRGLRDRYLLPTYPLLFYVMGRGVLWLVSVVARWRNRTLSDSARKLTWLAMVVVLAGFNVPKISRNAFYYSAMSYTPRYYKTIHSGRYAELMRVCGLLDGQGGAIGVYGDHASIVHYLARRPVISLAGAERVVDILPAFAQTHPQVGTLMYVAAEPPDEALDKLNRRLEELGFRSIWGGEGIFLWQRSSPAAQMRREAR